MIDWVFHKTRNDYTLSSQRGNIRIWANVAPDCIAISLSEISGASERGDFSYGKFLQIENLEASKKFVETLIQEMPDEGLEECSIYVVNKLKDYGKDERFL